MTSQLVVARWEKNHVCGLDEKWVSTANVYYNIKKKKKHILLKYLHAMKLSNPSWSHNFSYCERTRPEDALWSDNKAEWPVLIHYDIVFFIYNFSNFSVI